MKPSTKHKPQGTAPKALSLPPLTHCASLANQAIDAITRKEDGFARDTLPERLAIGLACMKAHAVFAMDPATQRAHARAAKSLVSRRDAREVSIPKSNKSTPASFEEWLARDLPRLQRVTAYKYMKAAAGLGLEPVGLDDCDIPILLKRWEKEHGTTATLASLVAANTLALGSGREPAPQQTEFEFFKECASSARAACESVCAIKSKLPEDFKRALSAQFYAALVEFTGTHWSPSDEAPDLANVDPASIQL